MIPPVSRTHEIIEDTQPATEHRLPSLSLANFVSQPQTRGRVSIRGSERGRADWRYRQLTNR